MSLTTQAERLQARARPALDGARTAVASAGERLLDLARALPVTERLTGRLTTARPAKPWLGALGWMVLGAGILAWLAGRRYGWVELTVLAIVAGVLLVLSLAFAVGRSAYEVTLDLAHRRVVVGERAVGRIEVRNASRRALLPADTTYVAIEGGNHAGFGRYGPQAGDNEATITPEAQQAQVVVATTGLLAALP